MGRRIRPPVPAHMHHAVRAGGAHIKLRTCPLWLRATAKEAVEQIRREAEAHAEVLAGGLHEKAAAVLVSGFEISKDVPIGPVAYADVHLYQAHLGAVCVSPSRHELEPLPPGDYRIITFILPLKR